MIYCCISYYHDYGEKLRLKEKNVKIYHKPIIAVKVKKYKLKVENE